MRVLFSWCLFLFLTSVLHSQIYIDENNLPNTGTSFRTVDIATADLDGDGDLDMVLANEFQENNILLNDGNGIFTNAPGLIPLTVHDTDDLVIADFDNNGYPDILFISEDNFGHEFYLNMGDLNFELGQDLPFSMGTAVSVCDLNNDGSKDIIIGNRASQNFALINDGNGVFVDETSERLPTISDNTFDLKFGDLDADGDMDLFIGNQDENRLLINDGEGYFDDESNLRLPTDLNVDTRKVTLGDIDNDGDLDVFLANVEFGFGQDPQNRLLINDGLGFFTDVTNTQLPLINDQTMEGIFHDYDNDGDLDLFIANVLHSSLLIYVNNGNGFFTDRTSEILGTENLAIDAWGLLLQDFDGDDYGDLYVCNRTGMDVLFTGDPTALVTSDINFDRNDSFTLFPNPVDEYLFVEFSAPISILACSLKDQLGKTIHNFTFEKIESQTFQLDLKKNELLNGLYFLSIETKTDRIVRPVIIQR